MPCVRLSVRLTCSALTPIAAAIASSQAEKVFVPSKCSRISLPWIVGLPAARSISHHDRNASGDSADPTRSPAFYDATYHYLAEIGITEV